MIVLAGDSFDSEQVSDGGLFLSCETFGFMKYGGSKGWRMRFSKNAWPANEFSDLVLSIDGESPNLTRFSKGEAERVRNWLGLAEKFGAWS